MSKKEPMSYGIFQITKDSFGGYLMGCGRSMHKLADLINSISNIRSHEGEILEVANHTSIEREVVVQITIK